MKRFLMIMGFVCTAVLGVIGGGLGIVGLIANQTADANKVTAVKLVKDVSRTWSLAHSQDTFTPAALAQASTPAGRRALATMSRLGRLKDFRKIYQTSYHVEFGTGTRVTIEFEGRFAYGTASVVVVVELGDDDARIAELDLKHIQLRRRSQQTAAA